MSLGLTPRLLARFLALSPEEKAQRLASMSFADLLTLDAAFELWAHPGQLPPKGEGWRNWLMMAGRGFGKTRAGAEWVHDLARAGNRRIAIVGASIDEARSVMIEGVSGLLVIARNRGVKLKWEPSLNRLTWRNGSVATLYSGDNPDGLRGPEHHVAWGAAEDRHAALSGRRRGGRSNAARNAGDRFLLPGRCWRDRDMGRAGCGIGLLYRRRLEVRGASRRDVGDRPR